MKQCPYCGTEFEGKFCPECGNAWQEDKTCPQCGSTLSANAKFCTECGYSFTEAVQRKPTKATQPKHAAPLLAKLAFALRLVPAALLALFGALSFAFHAAPAVKANLFGMSASENTYEIFSDESASFLKASAIALIVFGGIALLFGIFLLYRAIKNNRTKLEYGAYPVYLAVLIIASVMIGLIKKKDGGMGAFTAGAGETLFLVFSILFALFSVCASFAEKFLRKLNGDNEGGHNTPNSLVAPVPPEPALFPGQYKMSNDEPKVVKLANKYTTLKPLPWILMALIVIAYVFHDVPILLPLTGFQEKILIVGLVLFYAYCIVLSIAVGIFWRFKKRTTTWNIKERSRKSHLVSIVLVVVLTLYMFLQVLFLGQIIISSNIPNLIKMQHLAILFAEIFVMALPPLIANFVSLYRRKKVNKALFGTTSPNNNTPALVSFEELNADYLEYRKRETAYEEYQIAQAQYQYENFRYKHGISYEKKPPKFFFKLWVHKIEISVCALVLAIMVALPCIVFPILTNIFRISVVSKIELGSTLTDCEYILPTADQESDSMWAYYGENYKAIVKQINANEQKAESIESLEELAALIAQNEQLYAQLRAIQYKYIVVYFDHGIGDFSDHYVTQVVLDMARCDSAVSVEKKVKSVTLSRNRFSLEEMLLEDFSLTASITYKDGSYQKTYVPADAYRNVSNKAGKYTLAWSDSWGNYTATITLTE